MLFLPFPCKNHQAKYTFLPPAAPSILGPKIKQFKKQKRKKEFPEQRPQQKHSSVCRLDHNDNTDRKV